MRHLRRLRQRLAPPQLRLVYAGLPPEAGVPPPGYAARGLTAEDGPAWAALLDAGGELGPWSVDRLTAATADLVADTQVFATHAGILVAGAGVYDKSVSAWEVGWIATHPDHRGRGLGRYVTAAAVAHACRLPLRPILLFTDDHRVGAIRLYLRLGFRPDLCHRSHRRRWRAVGAGLPAELGDRLRRL